MVRPRTFLDFSINNESLGRVIFELYNDTVPKTCENFRVLCTGERGVSPHSQHPLYYKNSTIHRSIKEFMIQGGDFTKFNGMGGESIYGATFADEDLQRPLDAEALLCMANKGPNTNNSQFFITLRACSHLDGKHVVFGRVIRGYEVIQKISTLPVDAKDRPLTPVVISNCGELELRKPPPKQTGSIGRAASEKRGRRRSRSSSSRSRSRSASRSHSRDHEGRRHKKKSRKSKRKQSLGPATTSSEDLSKIDATTDHKEETEEEYDARLEREENERLEEARTRELARLKEKYDSELLKSNNGVRFKGRGRMKFVDPELGQRYHERPSTEQGWYTSPRQTRGK